MAEELKDLIEKIQEEGVRAAEDKARDIEKEAREQAGRIIIKAEREAENLFEEAKQKIAKMEASGKDSLKQAGRDLLLTLKKEINAILDRIVASSVHKALDKAELIKIITLLAKNCREEEKKDIQVSLAKEDLEGLRKGLLSELKDEIKEGITLKPSEDIRGGFIISYDKGKSHYDFTDCALAEYISAYLKPKLAEILNG